MSRNRFHSGVWQINNPDTANTKEISVDNQTVIVPAGSSTTVIVHDQLSFDAGKVEATWLARNQQDITGNVVGAT